MHYINPTMNEEIESIESYHLDCERKLPFIEAKTINDYNIEINQENFLVLINKINELVEKVNDLQSELDETNKK